MIELNVVSCTPAVSMPKNDGWKRASGQRNLSFPKISPQFNIFQKIYFSTSCDGEFRLNFDWSSYPIATSTIVAQTEAYALAKKVNLNN
jgi:hypothetical protein